MSETSTTTPATESALLSGPVAEALAATLDGDAIVKIAALGASATGIDIVIVEHSSDVPGLPERFPVAVVHGEQPKLISVKSFAEEFRTHPAFRLGQAKALTLESFIALVNRQKEGDSAIFVDSDWRKPSMTAVIDYHASDEVRQGEEIGAGKHRVHYAFPLDESWQAWIKGDGQPMEQADFAAMIEDRIADLVAPDETTKAWVERDFQTTVASPSALITLSRGLAVNVESRVKDFKTLQSGAGQVVFEEEHRDASGAPITIPGVFVLRLSPFFMGDPIEIPVRLRYRVRAGKIIWFYQIYRPDKSINEAVRNAIQDVRAQTELEVFEGAPEMMADGRTVTGSTGA